MPRKSTYIWQFQQTVINVKKFEKMWDHFKSDVFAALTMVDDKSP